MPPTTREEIVIPYLNELDRKSVALSGEWLRKMIEKDLSQQERKNKMLGK